MDNSVSDRPVSPTVQTPKPTPPGGDRAHKKHAPQEPQYELSRALSQASAARLHALCLRSVQVSEKERTDGCKAAEFQVHPRAIREQCTTPAGAARSASSSFPPPTLSERLPDRSSTSTLSSTNTLGSRRMEPVRKLGAVVCLDALDGIGKLLHHIPYDGEKQRKNRYCVPQRLQDSEGKHLTLF